MVAEYWKEGKWVNLPVINPSFTHLQLSLNSFGLEEGVEHELIWKFNPNGKFFVASVDGCNEPHVSWCSKAWIKHLSPKVNMFFGSSFLIKS